MPFSLSLKTAYENQNTPAGRGGQRCVWPKTVNSAESPTVGLVPRYHRQMLARGPNSLQG